MKLKKIKNQIMWRSRHKKLDHFYSLCAEGSVLDVGVSGTTTMASGNIFLKNFRFDDRYYTGLGVMDLSEVKAEYPDRRFVEYPGGEFPFGENEFDWVFSNAVVEHVGLDDEQLMFVNEMLRVGKKVFFTTPNKYFPIEPHTNLLFLHWSNKRFYKWCEKHRPWTNKSNLYLFSYRRLKNVMDKSNASNYKIFRNHLAFWPMTYTVVCWQD